MSPLDRFLYWIEERHQIYLRRKVGKPKPWTKDPVLRDNFFTNPYRENDKVTVWFRENIREPLRNDSRVLMATIIFRWFNLPETARRLRQKTGTEYGAFDGWDHDDVLSHLSWDRDKGKQIFTGAYMINSPGGEKKLEAICRRIDGVWQDREKLLERFLIRRSLGQSHPARLAEAHSWLTEYDGLGGFMAYEIVCDLRHTYLLDRAPDILTWSNPGPGAIRGLYRVLGREFEKGNNASSPPRPKDWDDRTAELLRIMNDRLRGMPRFEMREVEHSLCEFDKYERARTGDGKMKRKFNGR